MDLEGTIEKVQESPVLVQARNLPGGPRRYHRKSAGKFICTGAGKQPFQVDLEGTIEKVQESSSVAYWCRPGTFQVDLEGTVEKVQEISSVLLQDIYDLL